MKKVLLILLAVVGSLTAQAQNLLPNGGFENDLTSWWTQAGTGTNASFTISTAEKYEGTKALRVEVITPGASAWNVQAVNNPFTAEVGKNYVLTFWAKAATAGSAFKVVIQGAQNTYQERTFTLSSSWAKYEWTFDAREASPQVKFHFPNAGTFFLDDFFIPSGVQFQELLKNGSFESGSGNNFANWWHAAGGGSVAAITGETGSGHVQQGARALKVAVTTPGANGYDIQVVSDAWASEAGKQYTLSFYAKAAQANSQMRVVVQNISYTSRDFTLSTEWVKYSWTFTASEGGLTVRLNFPFAGTFWIDNMSIPGTIGTMPDPYTPTGPPIATGKPKFLGNVYSASQLPNFLQYFNQVTPENSGKWGDVERIRNQMTWTGLDAAYKFAKDNGLPFRMHVLLWGNQQPTWMAALSRAEQLAEIREWFAAVAARYPSLDFIEVVNEPVNDPPRKRNDTDLESGDYIEALGGNGTTGWDWIITSFQLAREYFPNAKLMINEYSVTNSQTNAQRYIGIINLLKERNLIDIVGIQGHAFETTVSAEETKRNLDRIAATGKPIMVTEMDIDGSTDAQQLANYQRIFPIFWEHPSVMGVTLWGYRPGMWRTEQGAYLAYANGAERPAFKWLQDYIKGNTNNHSPVIAASQVFAVSEAAVPGAIVGQVQATDADPNTTFAGWWIKGGTGASLFSIDAATGQLKVAAGAQLDFEQTTSYTLALTVHDSFSTSALQEVTIQVTNVNDHTPVVTAAQSFTIDGGVCNVIGTVMATDADDTNQPKFTTFQNWKITGGSGKLVFDINQSTGSISLANPGAFDFKVSAYTLLLTVSDGTNTSTTQTVQITVPQQVMVCQNGNAIQVAKEAIPGLLKQRGCLGQCAPEAASAQTAQAAGLEGGERNLKVYPNPATNRFTIDLGANDLHINRISVLELATGKLVLEVPVAGQTEVMVPRGRLARGMYLIRMQGDQEVFRKLLID